MDDLAELFERYRTHGDLAALGAVFDHAAPRLLALALHLCGNPADAEDALQATFVSAMRKAAAFDRGQRLEPWLAGILTGEARNLARRAGRRATESLPDVAGGGPDPVATAERAELVAELRTHVGALPPEQRQALMLQLQHGLSPAEIAEVLEVPPGTVRMRLHRGLAALRKLLPAGLAGLLAQALPARGLAAIRHAVLAAAQETAAAQSVAPALVPGVIGGLLAMKKVLSLVAVVVIAAIGWWWIDAQPQVGNPVEPVGRRSAPALATDHVVPPVPSSRAADTTASTRVALETEPGSLLVRVYLAERSGDDAPRKPVADAALQIWSGDVPLVPFDGGVRELRTDAAGEASFGGLSSGRWQLLCPADPRAEPRAVVVEPARETVVEVVRAGARIVRGRVVDTEGLPVAGAELCLLRSNSVSDRGYLVTEPELRLRTAGESDAAGRFEFAAVAEETSVGARKEGHAPSFGCSTAEADVTLVLGRAWSSVSGTVCDAAGQPVASAVVVVTPAGRDVRRAADGSLLLPRLPHLGRTDHHGRFVFGGLPPGVQKLVASAGPRMGWREVEVAVHARAEVELRLIDGVTVVGTVRRVDGAPAAGLQVRAIRKRGSDGHLTYCATRADGSFLMTPVQARRFVVSVELPGPRAQALVDREYQDQESGLLRCDFVVPDLAELSGRVVDARGEPLPGWCVDAGPESHPRLARSVTGADGRFLLRNLPGETFSVTAHAPDGDPQHPAVACTGVRGGATELELRVADAAMPKGSVSGRLVSDGGVALAGTEVVLRSVAASRWRIWKGHEAQTSGDGTFRFGRLSPGGFELLISAGNDQAQPFTKLTLEPAQQLDLGTLRMRPMATLRVEYARADGSPWRTALPYVWVYDGAGKRIDVALQSGDGAHEAQLEPQRYRVEVVGDDLIATPQEVELEAGGSRTLRFTVAIGRTRSLVFNGDGKDKLLGRDDPLHVEVRGADGALVEEGGVPILMPDLRGFRYWYLDHTFPYGRYVVTARAGSGRRYRAEFEVRDDLDDPSRIDVPAID